MTRELLKTYDTIVYPVKKHNLLNVKAMFKDLEDITILPVDDDNDMIKKYQRVFLPIKIGCFEQPNFILRNEDFCKAFYRQSNIDYEKRWESFYINRDKEKENLLRSEIGHKYIFVHDDISRGLVIKNNFKHKIYRPNHILGKDSQNSIFDYIKLIEDSEEIHCMDSSFAAMIDHIPELKDKPKFIHRYIRKNNANPYYKNNWVILNE